MPDHVIDPDLPGIWIIPGEAFTYEIDDEGNYHVAAPPQPLTVGKDGQGMVWGTVRLERIGGTEAAPIGAWRAVDTGDEWLFQADGNFLQRGSDGTRTTGIWVLDAAASTLWTREYRGQLETDGARVQFHLAADGSVTYGYTVDAGAWTLLDATSWEKLVEYHRAPGPEGAAR